MKIQVNNKLFRTGFALTSFHCCLVCCAESQTCVTIRSRSEQSPRRGADPSLLLPTRSVWESSPRSVWRQTSSPAVLESLRTLFITPAQRKPDLQGVTRSRVTVQCPLEHPAGEQVCSLRQA